MSKIVSVIIPSLERQPILFNSLRDIVSLNYPNFEVIVVDQSEKMIPGFEDFIKKNKIKYITPKEVGTSRAKNTGASAAKGEIIIFLDDDVRIKDKNFISNHVKNYDDSGVGGIGGRVLMDSDKPLSQIKEVGKFKYFGLKEITNFNADFRAEIDHVYGCNQSYRKSVFDKVGGFQLVYGGNAHLEEADLSLRVKEAGYKIYFDPKAVLEHLHVPFGGCRAKDEYELRYWLIHNATIFYLRHYNHALFLLYFLRQYAWAILAFLKRWDTKMFKTMTGAIFDGVKYYEKISGKT